MVRVLESKQISKTGDVVVCQVTTDMPWPVSNLRSKTKAIHKVGPPVWSRTWSLLEGDFISNRGFWKLKPFGDDPKRTLVVYNIHVVPDIAVPDALLRKGMTSTLPDMITNLRKQVE
jgi:hypothetical protein